MRLRRDIILAFDAIMEEKLKIADKIKDVRLRPPIKVIEGKRYIQIEEVISDNDPSMIAKSPIFENDIEKLRFSKHLKKYYGCKLGLRPNPSGEKWLNGKAEEKIKRVKCFLRCGMFDCSLALRYWTSCCVLIQQLWYYLPSTTNIDSASPCRILEMRTPSFKKEIANRFFPFGTVIQVCLTEEQRKRKAFSIFGIRGAVGHYLHPSLTRRFSITVLVGIKKFDVSLRQVGAVEE